jgi:putative transcriptional regulator
MTLVLLGGFTSLGRRFGRGDVEIADDSVEHQPVADDGDDCVCLAVTDAPLRFKSLAARLVQPFIGI